MPQVVKKSQYRQRVFQGADGTITLVFGSDPAPLNADGTTQKVLADHDIVDSATITDHVEPQP